VGIWLVDEQHRVVTPDRYHAGYRPEKIKEIEGVIYHFTASTRPDPTRRWLTRKDKYYVSAHFLVDRDGETWQMAALDERTYHAGGPSSKMFGRGNVNGRTIGIRDHERWPDRATRRQVVHNVQHTVRGRCCCLTEKGPRLPTLGALLP